MQICLCRAKCTQMGSWAWTAALDIKHSKNVWCCGNGPDVDVDPRIVGLFSGISAASAVRHVVGCGPQSL